MKSANKERIKLIELASFILDLGNNFSKLKDQAWSFIVMSVLTDRPLRRDEIVKNIEEVSDLKMYPFLS